MVKITNLFLQCIAILLSGEFPYYGHGDLIDSCSNCENQVTLGYLGPSYIAT